MTKKNKKPYWLDDFTDGNVEDLAKGNFHNFYEMKEYLILKRRSLCSIEDMAKELGCTVDDVVEFEQYYSDPTISEIQEYAIATMSEIEIKVSDYKKSEGAENDQEK